MHMVFLRPIALLVVLMNVHEVLQSTAIFVEYSSVWNTLLHDVLNAFSVSFSCANLIRLI